MPPAHRYTYGRAGGSDIAVPLAASAAPIVTAALPPRAPSRRAPGPSFRTAIELHNGADHGNHEAETAARLAFRGLRIDRVQFVPNFPPMAPR